MRRTARYDRIFEQNTAYNNGFEFTTLNGESTIEYNVPSKPSEYDQVTGNRLQRFLLRAIVGVLGPFVVCAYFIVIWRLYLVPAQAERPITFGLRGATWIFYSWFVAGVLGLSLSLYGLAGVEAAMLMEPTWNIGDATRLMLHADKTWSGPGGWLKTMQWALIPQKGRNRRLPSYSWFILALPSILIFIAWPLSGLTMETTQGFCHPNVAALVSVTGFSYDTMNERGPQEALKSASLAWRSGRDARIPGAGIVYTPEGFDRSRAAFLDQLPAVLPRDDGVPTIFLVPQADNPSEGTQWGLLLRYNCTVINGAQDFQLLNKVTRPSSRYSRLGLNASIAPGIHYENFENKFSITTMNKTDQKRARNLDVVLEYGAQFWEEGKLPPELAVGFSNYDCYLNTYKNLTGDYPGIHQDYVSEIALWQALEDRYTVHIDNFSLPYNLSIDHNITDYYGTYKVEGFHDLLYPRSSLPMTAIGVQCRASSDVGRADINGIKSTYSNFQRTDTGLPRTWDRCAVRLMAHTPGLMIDFEQVQYDWLSAMFKSLGAPAPFYGTYDATHENGSQYKQPFTQQSTYLQAEQLRHSLLHAYASYAVQLMYNGGEIYTTPDGSTLSFTNPNVTAFQPATVIKPGVVPAIIPLGFFCVWALISSALGLIYGFRRRWTETLDGHTMFRMGAELSEHARRELLKTSNIGKKEDDKALNEIPGFVGDAKPEMWVGRVGLVARGKADKKKLYE